MNYESIFVSDLHIGLIENATTRLLSFLNNNVYKNLFFIGDVYDDLLDVKFYPNNITKIEKYVHIASTAYIIGNHDYLRPGPKEFFYTSAITNKKYLLLHGNKFDSRIRWNWLTRFGANIFNFLCLLDLIFPKIKRYSLAEEINKSITNLKLFKELALKEKNKRGFDAIVVGHTHAWDVDDQNGYYNIGEMVTKEATLLAEDLNGNIVKINV